VDWIGRRPDRARCEPTVTPRTACCARSAPRWSGGPRVCS
jgi:hypothetical protein